MFRRRKGFADFSARQRIAMAFGGLVQLGLLVAAQLDLLRRPAKAVRGSKWAWRAVTLVNFVGPLAYFAFGRRPVGGAPALDSVAADAT